MRHQIYRILDRTLAAVEVVFGAGTLFGLALGVIAGPEQTRPLEWILGIPVMIVTIVAGVLLWRGRRRGFALSLGLQLFQVLPVIIGHTAVRYVAGFHWTPRFGGSRIWKPWGLEGTFIVLHDPSFPSTMFGLNVVALAIAIYLGKLLYDTSQNSAVISAQQLSY
jgi:hypothetical protein